MILETAYWLTMVTQCFIYVFCWNQLLPHRFKQTYLIGVPYSTTLYILSMFCYQHAILSYAAANIIKIFSGLSVIFILYSGSRKRKLGIWIATELISLLCTFPVEMLFSFLCNISIDQIALSKNDTIGGVILLNNVLLIVSIIVDLLYNKKSTLRTYKSTQTLIALCSAIIHFGFSCVQFANRAVLQRNLNCLVHSAFQMILFILIYIQYTTALHNWELTRQAQELEHIRLQQDYTYSYYLLAEQRFKDVALLRQDMQNLMNTVQTLNASERVLQSHNTIEDTITTDQHFCNIPVIDAVLRLKTQKATQYGIHTEFCLQDFAVPLPFSNFDLCSIFVNLLDNAIHSCSNDTNLKDHFIQLQSVVEQDCFVVTVANSYGWADFPHETTQPDDTSIIGHGHGTKIVESIAQKYRGSFALQRNDKIVTARLYLPITAREEMNPHV